MILTGDIGGTKTDLAVYDPERGPRDPVRQAEFVSRDYPGLAVIALKTLAPGGVYLAGGIPMHILPALDRPEFLAAYHNKGRMSQLMEAIPLHVITSQAALIGAASFGLAMASQPGKPGAKP